MSLENVETVRQALDALNLRDVERYLSYRTEDVELQAPTSAIEGVYEGQAGVRRFFAATEYPDFRLDAERIEAVGVDRVIASLHVTGTGRASGAAIGMHVTNVYDLADGKIRRVRVFQDRAAAMEAAELPE